MHKDTFHLGNVISHDFLFTELVFLPLSPAENPLVLVRPNGTGPGVFTLMEKGELVPMLEAAGCALREA